MKPLNTPGAHKALMEVSDTDTEWGMSIGSNLCLPLSSHPTSLPPPPLPFATFQALGVPGYYSNMPNSFLPGGLLLAFPSEVIFPRDLG